MAAVQNAFGAWCAGEAKPTVRIVRQYKAPRPVDDYEEMTDGNAYGGSNPRYQ